MPIEIVFETHALTEDNERGIATGWLPGQLSERGRGGESHAQAIARVAGFLADLPSRWADRRVLLIGHLATYRAGAQVVPSPPHTFPPCLVGVPGRGRSAPTAAERTRPWPPS